MTLRIIRALLVFIFVLGLIGSALELILLEHFEEPTQLIPLALMGVAGIMLGWYAASRSRAALRAIRATTTLFVLAGLTGIVLHYVGNRAFELEMYPELKGLDLFWESITGATPALAPGTMVMLGLIGWLFTFRHPVLLRRGGLTPDLPPDETNRP